MDDFEPISQGRERRAAGLIAIGLALALVGGIVYLRPFARPPAPAPATTTLTGHFYLPNDMQWPSPDEGWLVFNDSSNHISLFHTRDAGRHWQTDLVLPGVRGAGLRFFDSRNGVLRFRAEAAGVNALRTKDGGRSWQPFPLPNLGAASGDVEFSDPQHAWLAASAPPTSPAGAPAFDLRRTADGGRHWQRFPNGALSGLPQPPSGPPLFASAQDGWVQIGNQLYASHDGGDSWQPESLELPAPGSVSLLQAIVSPGRWVTLTFAGSTPSSQVPHGVETWVAASSDGGHTWQGLVHTPETRNLNPGAGPDWHPPTFSDARNGWLVGPVMYTTADSGLTWNRKTMPADAVCVDVTPVSARTAWCAAHYPKGVRLFRTTDGGRQWSGVDPPI